jgi:hypothetical protein
MPACLPACGSRGSGGSQCRGPVGVWLHCGSCALPRSVPHAPAIHAACTASLPAAAPAVGTCLATLGLRAPLTWSKARLGALRVDPVPVEMSRPRCRWLALPAVGVLRRHYSVRRWRRGLGPRGAPRAADQPARPAACNGPTGKAEADMPRRAEPGAVGRAPYRTAPCQPGWLTSCAALCARGPQPRPCSRPPPRLPVPAAK